MDDHDKWSGKIGDEAEFTALMMLFLQIRNRMKEKDWHNSEKTPEFAKQIVDSILERKSLS